MRTLFVQFCKTTWSDSQGQIIIAGDQGILCILCRIWESTLVAIRMMNVNDDRIQVLQGLVQSTRQLCPWAKGEVPGDTCQPFTMKGSGQ